MGMSANVIQKQRPALRLVSTKGLSRDEWLKVRKQGIGSSDAAAAVEAMSWGLGPYGGGSNVPRCHFGTVGR